MALPAYCVPWKPGRVHLRKMVRIMKFTTLFLFVAIMHVSAKTYSQKVSLSLTDVPLKTVFLEINAQTGYNFLYSDEMLSASKNVTLNVKNAPLEDVLTICFKDQPFSFTIQNNSIVITQKSSSNPLKPASENLPPIDIHGRVTDSLGNPLAGVSVTVKGGKVGTSTDASGNFVLYGVNENAILVISNVGYADQLVKIKGKTAIAISLKAQSTSLTEVVVNKGYYTTTQALNTGDVSTVGAAEIEKQPVTDPILALEGRVPGLFIQQASGIPGAYSLIQIMGQNSIANGNDPFYIIDGVPFTSVSLSLPNYGGGAAGNSSNSTFNQSGGGISPFNSLNPADIESITVLKDADATAIYGSRGANGVILITTKKGKVGKTRVDLNVYTGGGKITRMMPMMNTTQYLAMRREAFQNDGLPVPSVTTDPTNTDFDINGVWDTTRYTNWQKLLIGNTATLTNAQASVSGGNTNTQFLVGGGYSKQGTPYIGNYYDEKISGNANLTHTSSNQRFHLQLGVNYVYDNNKMPTGDFTAPSQNLAPDAPAVYDKYGNLNWQIFNGGATWANPLASTLENAKAATDNFISSLNLSYQILPGLKLLSSFGYNHDEMQGANYIPAGSQAPPNNSNPFSRSYGLSSQTFEKWIVEPQLNYVQNIGRGRLEALVGTTFQQSTTNYYGLVAAGYTSDALITDPLAASYVALQVFNDILYRYNAVYGRLGYNWDEKYLINLTARRDGSSRFGPGKQYGNFGAVGLGWIFSKENFFLNNLNFISFGKLRGSYGITGNDQITDYQYLSTYSPNGAPYLETTGLNPNGLTNPYFAWEIVKKLQGGIDLGFIKDRIMISAVYYRNRTGNQLVGYTLPYITGFNSVQFNFPAVVQNSGLELTINTVNIKTKDFSWSSSVNLTLPSNKLVAYPNIESSPYTYTYVVGQSLSIRRLWHSTGVDPQTGLYTVATKDPNGPDFPQDLVTTKPITQNYYGGFDNKFAYKGLSLDVFIQFVNQLGGSWVSGSQPGTVNQNEPTYILNRWQTAGDLTSTQRFGTTSSTATAYANYTASDAMITNTSFVRIKNVALSYELPEAWKTKSHVETMRVYLQCQNLFTISKYSGMDPETGPTSLPPLRMITGGFQIGF